MKIGVVNDSHGHAENPRKAINKMRGAGVGRIVHLGDDYEDITVIQVPGVFSTYYQKKTIPNRIIEHWEGVRALLTHTPEAHEKDLPTDLKPEEVIASGKGRMVLYGHSHVPEVKERDLVIWINPRHLKDADKKVIPLLTPYWRLLTPKCG